MKIKRNLITYVVCIALVLSIVIMPDSNYAESSTDTQNQSDTLITEENEANPVDVITGIADGKHYKKSVIIGFPAELTCELTKNDEDAVEIESGYIVATDGNYVANFYLKKEESETNPEDENLNSEGTEVNSIEAEEETPEKTINFVIDTVAPKVTGVTNNKIYANKTLTIAFNEGKATLDGKTFKSGTKYAKYGDHKLVVTDTAGNSTTVKFTMYKAKLVTTPTQTITHSRMISDINKLASQYPGLVKKSYIGKSVAGKQIPLVRLGKGSQKILIIGSEHGREHVSTNMIMRSIDTYAKSYAQGTSIEKTSTRNVLNKVTFYFVPMVNPDGVAIATGKANKKQVSLAKKYTGTRHYNRYKRLWKANARGVDINRNYPFKWYMGHTARKRAYMGYKGRYAASEPELKAIVKLCSQNKFKFMFTMHTRGQVIYWRDAHTKTIKGADKLSKRVAAITGYKRMKTSPKSGGTAESAKWFRNKYRRPAFTIELTPYSTAYSSAPKKFNTVVWKRNKALFLKTALTI